MMFSLVIPCYNESESLPTLIEKCLALISENIEIILVDNGSSDSTPEILRPFEEQNRVVVNPEELHQAIKKPVDIDARKQLIDDYLLRLSTNYNQIQLDDLFFQCLISSNDIILKNSYRVINSSVDAYGFLQTVKKFAKILIITSEQKSEKSLSILVDNYLPKYLFKQRDNFTIIINRANINKIVIINNLILKTELFLRKNNVDYLIIIQRFMLNCAKALK